MFLEHKPDDIACVKKMKAEMSKNLAKRLPSEEREICMLSSLLHPKTKQLGFLDAAEKETAKFLLSSTAKNSHSDSGTSGIKTEPEVLSTSTNQVPTPSVDNFTIKREVEVEELEREIFVGPKAKKICTTDHSQAWLDDIICVANDSVETGTLIDQEIQRYLAEPLGTNQCALTWWKEREASYPILSKLAKKYLAIPATSVPSERIFSLAGNLVTKKRALLSPETVNILIFLNKNRKS